MRQSFRPLSKGSSYAFTCNQCCRPERDVLIQTPTTSFQILKYQANASQTKAVILEQFANARVQNSDEGSVILDMGSRIRLRLFGTSESNYSHLPVKAIFKFEAETKDRTNVEVSMSESTGWYPIRAPWVSGAYKRRYNEIVGLLIDAGLWTSGQDRRSE